MSIITSDRRNLERKWIEQKSKGMYPAVKVPPRRKPPQGDPWAKESSFDYEDPRTIQTPRRKNVIPAREPEDVQVTRKAPEDIPTGKGQWVTKKPNKVVTTPDIPPIDWELQDPYWGPKRDTRDILRDVYEEAKKGKKRGRPRVVIERSLE